MNVSYGFIDENNVLIATATCIENDTNTLERIKNDYSAINYYPIKDIVVLVNSSIWTGESFTTEKIYNSWIWNNEIKMWEPPVPMPNIAEGATYHYSWDEPSISWKITENN